jgi:uncharacterized membrane protein YoaK (UPF0700 family)
MYPAKGVHLKDFKTEWFVLVMFCACVFAFNGGYINAVSFAGVWKTGLTHLTGSTTNSAVRLLNPPKPGGFTAVDLGLFIFGFFLGAFVSGLIIGPPRLRWGRLQGACMIIMGFTLLLGWWYAPTVFGGTLVAFAMGVQNSITSNFMPLTIRTSHVSGTVLDIGMAIGQCIHLRNLDHLWKIKVHVPTFAAFWVGALVGTAAWNQFAEDALLINALFGIVGGLLTMIVRTWWVMTASEDDLQEAAELNKREVQIPMEEMEEEEEEEEEKEVQTQSLKTSQQGSTRYGT